MLLEIEMKPCIDPRMLLLSVSGWWCHKLQLRPKVLKGDHRVLVIRSQLFSLTVPEPPLRTHTFHPQTICGQCSTSQMLHIVHVFYFVNYNMYLFYMPFCLCFVRKSHTLIWKIVVNIFIKFKKTHTYIMQKLPNSHPAAPFLTEELATLMQSA